MVNGAYSGYRLMMGKNFSLVPNKSRPIFRKIKGVRGNSEVSTIDKSVFAPFFLFINFF